LPVALVAQAPRVALVDLVARAVAADRSLAAKQDLAALAALVAQVAAVVVPGVALVGLLSRCSTPVRARLW
jgi:hypothetical protein